MRKLIVILALLSSVGCTSGRTDDVLRAVGTWDVAHYGAEAYVNLTVDSASFEVPGWPSPIHVENLKLKVRVKLGKYGGDEILLDRID